jgi:hypothetical protein
MLDEAAMQESAKPAAGPKAVSEQAAEPVLSARLRTALELHDSGVALKRAQLRRADPRASEELIVQRLGAWLRSRPGALHGDSEGVLRSIPGEST